MICVLYLNKAVTKEKGKLCLILAQITLLNEGIQNGKVYVIRVTWGSVFQ